MAGLRLFRENPFDRRAQVTAAMMKDSGFAKPFLAMALGRDVNRAEEFDREQEASAMSMYGEENNRAAAFKTLMLAAQMSDKDPQAANDILEAEAKKNPAMEPFKDIKFAGEGRGRWKFIQAGNTVGWFDMEGAFSQLSQLGPNPPPEKATEIFKNSFHPIGGANTTEPPEVRDFQEGKENVTKQWDPESKTWKEVPGARGPKWNPDKGGKARSVTDVRKDILTTAKAIASLEDEGLTNKLLATFSKDPKIQEVLKASGNTEQAKADLQRLRDDYISEYEQTSGQKWEETGTPESGNIQLPSDIRTTSQAIDFLMNNHGMTREAAINWIRSNVNAS